VVYYALLGLIFGGINFEDNTTVYTLGWVDNDTTKANYNFHPQFNLSYIYDVIQDNVSSINLIKYNSTEEAQKAALNGTVSGYVVFPDGFEEYLEKRSMIRMAFWDNDNSSSIQGYSILGLYYSLIQTTYSMFQFTNITDGDAIKNNFDDYEYDVMLIVNDNFEKGLDNNWNVNMSYFYRKNTTEAKNYYITGTIESLTNNYFHTINYNCRSNVSITTKQEIAKSTPFEPPQIDFYFVQTLSPAIRATIENVISEVISRIINNNPVEISIDHEVKSVVGRKVNNITFSAPGYLLYGPMCILSFALVVLTGEKKEGIYKRLSSTEVANWEIILSNIVSNVMLIFMQFGIGAAILSLFGWNPIVYSPLDAILGIIVTMFLFSFFILALAFALAPIFKDPDSAAGGVWIILIPLSMMSGIFVPIELFGEQMQAIAAWLPPRFAIVALQNLLLNGQPLGYPGTLVNLGILALISTAIFIVGIKYFNKFKRQ
jgi:ABC-2 type transport system permease protein